MVPSFFNTNNGSVEKIFIKSSFSEKMIFENFSLLKNNLMTIFSPAFLRPRLWHFCKKLFYENMIFGRFGMFWEKEKIWIEWWSATDWCGLLDGGYLYIGWKRQNEDFCYWLVFVNHLKLILCCFWPNNSPHTKFPLNRMKNTNFRFCSVLVGRAGK